MDQRRIFMNQTKPDYGNWVPLNMIRLLAVITALFGAAALLSAVALENLVLTAVFALGAAVFFLFCLYMLRCRALFDFNRGGLMGTLHQYLLDHLEWDGDGRLLDVGCGSGALISRCAKKYPRAQLTGIDDWGAQWNYAKKQCETNAALEGIAHQVRFQKGDAAHLDFPDSSFDAVISNFVFHEVQSEPNKRKVVREALRVLKKGGCFSFQDMFSQKALYGDMEEFAQSLRDEGFAQVHFVPWVERRGFVPPFIQAPWMLRGVGLLYGRK